MYSYFIKKNTIKSFQFAYKLYKLYKQFYGFIILQNNMQVAQNKETPEKT